MIAAMDPEAEGFEARFSSVMGTVNEILPGVYSTPSTDPEEIQSKIQFAIRLASFVNEGNGPVVDILKSISYDVLGLSLLATGMDDEARH